METSKLKKVLHHIPEVLILLVALYWFLDNLLATPSHVNYFMLAVIAFVSALIVSRNKIMALLLSLIIGVGSLYMLLAVFSEYHEFPKGDADGLKLLLVGVSMFVLTLSASIFIPIKYFKKQ